VVGSLGGKEQGRCQPAAVVRRTTHSHDMAKAGDPQPQGRVSQDIGEVSGHQLARPLVTRPHQK
jgi:hypothetical protein